MKQNETQSELQKRVAAELQDKAKKRKALEDAELPDGVTDSVYLKDTKSTTSLAWVWVLIAIAIVGIAIWLIVATM